MLDFLLAATAWALVVLAPGGLAVLAVRPELRSEPVFVLAAAPAVSLGSWFVIGELFDLIGLGLWPWMPLTGAVLLPLLALAALVRSSGAPRDGSAGSSAAAAGRRRPARAALALLAVAMLLGLAVWGAGIAGGPSSPPSRDSEYHAIFVKRIVETGTVSAAEVLVSDPVTEQQIAEFYPLGLHVAVALGHRLGGGDIGTMLTAWMVMFAAITLPAGQFTLMRRLLPGEPLAAGIAALVAPLFVLVTYHPAGWGAVPLVAGFAMLPATLVLLAMAGDSPAARWGCRFLAALAVVGIAASHTSQLALLVVLLLGLELSEIAATRGHPGVARGRIASLATVGAMALLLYLPTLPAMLGAVGERADVLDQPFSSTGASLGTLLTFSYPNVDQPQPLLAAIAAAGIWLAARDRVLGRWALCLGLVTALYLATRTAELPWSLIRPATTPWYSSTWRTAYNVAFVAQLFAAYTLLVALRGVGALRSRTRAGAVRVLPVVAVSALAVLGGIWLLREPVERLRAAWLDSRPTAEMEAAFEFLDGRVAPGEPILNDDLDGSPWMYPSAGLHPLLAVERAGATERSADDRAFLASRIHEYDSDPRVRRLVEEFGVRFVLVSDERWLDYDQRNSRARLLESDSLEEVFSAGSAHVFRIVP